MKPVVAALHDENVIASQLVSAVKAASADVKLPALTEVAMARELSYLSRSADLDGYFNLLRGSAESVVKIEEIDENIRSGFIIQAVIRAISDLCRQEKKADVLTKCVDAAQRAVSDMDELKATDGGKELLADLQALGHLMAPMHDGFSDEDLSNSKKLLDPSKSHRFYKPFALFPTGQQVMQGAAEAVLARSKDAGFLRDLKSTIASAASLPPEPSVKVVDDAIAIARMAEYRQLFQALAKLKAAGSERFESTNKGELAELQNRLDKLIVAVDAVWKQGPNSIFQKVLTHFVKAWSVKASVKHFNDAVDVVMNKTLDPNVFLKGTADELTISGDLRQFVGCRFLASLRVSQHGVEVVGVGGRGCELDRALRDPGGPQLQRERACLGPRSRRVQSCRHGPPLGHFDCRAEAAGPPEGHRCNLGGLARQ